MEIIPVNFIYDDNTIIIIPAKNDDNINNILWNQHKNDHFKTRPWHEIIFRSLITELIKNDIINKNKNIIDLGAWIGDNVLPWAKMVKSTIYAIDPSINNCNYIANLAELNNIENIKIIQQLISDKEETLSYNGTVDHNTFNSCDNENRIDATFLDKLYDEKEIDNIGFIHLDVEGMEYKVICGAEKIIKIFRPIIAFECHINTDEWKDSLINLLKKMNYTVYMIDEILPGCLPDCRNFIVVPYEKNELLLNNCELIGMLVKK